MLKFTKKTKNEIFIKTSRFGRFKFDNLPKKFLFLLGCLMTALFFITCANNNSVMPMTNGDTNTNVDTNVDTNGNSNVIPIDSNIIVNNNLTFPFAENSAIDNFDINLKIGDYYAIATNYDVSNVFVEHQTGADASIFDTSALIINTDDPTNRFITGNISFPSLDFESPSDGDGNNTYELAKFVITNVDGGSNSFALEVTIVNLIELSTNRAATNVNLYTSNIMDLTEVLDINERGTYIYQLSGADRNSFKIETNLLRTVNDLGFRNIYENDGQYEVEVGYIAGEEMTTLTLTVSVGPIHREVTAAAEWSTRLRFQSVVLDNNDILVMGRDLVTNDVWRSANDGFNWSEITSSNRWSIRAAFQAEVLANNDILVMGGVRVDGTNYLNDVWLSSDSGTNWNEITASAPWSVRSGLQAVVLGNDDILVMGGGADGVILNDVWLSRDGGTNWSQIPASNHWSVRSGFQAVVLGNDDILVMGGNDVSSNFNDVWLSSDGGTNWKQITASAPWSARFDFQAVALGNDDILVMGGNGGNGRNNLWLSRDGGTNWSKEITDEWLRRIFFQAVVLANNDVLVMGGMGSTFFNDVWVREGENRGF